MEKAWDLILDPKLFKDYFLNDEDNSIEYFPKFNSLNIIVGANNCGKSRFLRQLMSLNSYNGIKDLLLRRKLINDYNLHVEMFNKDKIEQFIRQHTVRSAIGGSNVMDAQADRVQKNRLLKLKEEDFNNISNVIEDNKKRLGAIASFSNLRDDFLKNYSRIEETYTKEFKPKKYYIPTLRTAHSLFQIIKHGSEKKLDVPGTNDYEKIEKDIFLHTYLQNYQIDRNVQIFTGLHLYRDILNSRNSEKNVRIQFENFEKFLSVNFFDGKQIDIVAKFDKNDNEKGINESELILIHVEGERETRKLYDLGDGVQALIVLMYKIFMAEPESFIFIDEPELNLHPGMQRLFLEQITSNIDLTNKNLRFIITTHSNHFLDLTIEEENVSIYSFSQKNNESNDKLFTIKNVNRGNNLLLHELGVNNSSVFMANCSVWVEGISDRTYIKAFLKSYMDYLLINKKKEKFVSVKEDIDFAFFEYAGSNIDHYFFADEMQEQDEKNILRDIKALSLSNRIFLLADSDAASPRIKKQKYHRLKLLENAKSSNFKPRIIWNIREIENLLTNDIWKKVLIKLCHEKFVKEDEQEIQDKINLALNDIDASNYKKEYIGKFLNEVREKIGKKGKKNIFNKVFEINKNSEGEISFGTIIHKRELSELVAKNNFPWTVLSQNREIKDLTIEIYNFITQKKDKL